MSSQFTEDNRKFFDDLASKYDVAQWMRDFSASVAEYLQGNLDLFGLNQTTGNGDQNISLLDYACGTGVVSRALGPYVASIQGLDLSTKMVERYQELASSSTVSTVKSAIVRQGDIVAEAEPLVEISGPDLHNFSLVVVCAGFHHFENFQRSIDRLAQRLKPGGTLLIVDFVETQGTQPMTAADHTIHKHGFSENEMKTLFENAGLANFGWRVKPEKVVLKLNSETPVYRELFLAKAVRQ